MTSRRRLAAATAIFSLLVCGALVATASIFRRPSAAEAPAEALAELVERCEADMLRGVCRAQAAPAEQGPPERVVFVAGVGAIDGAAYRSLQASGTALCGVIRQSCERDWHAPQCRAARALHRIR